MFKRNQVETAVGALMDGRSDGASEDLRIRIKRLLNSDRDYAGEVDRIHGKQNYAFYRDKPPGQGTDVWFSAYEAFAILTGLQLMRHGWSQTFAVDVMRKARSDLEKAHTRILRLNPDRLFDKRKIVSNLKAGDPAFETTDPQFLVIILKHGIENMQDHYRPFDVSVQQDATAAMMWVSARTKGVGGGSAMFELTVPAFQLHAALAHTAPKRRGRSG